MTRLALYFGYGPGGHSFPHGHWLRGLPGPRSEAIDPQHDVPGFPWRPELLDTGLLNNGRVADQPDGRVWWTCGGVRVLWHAFYWWDRSGDSRPASNSGFYVRGFPIELREEAFAFALEAWPAVVARQQHPLRLEPWPRR